MATHLCGGATDQAWRSPEDRRSTDSLLVTAVPAGHSQVRGGRRGVPRDPVLRRETQGIVAEISSSFVWNETRSLYCVQVAVGKTGGLEYPRSKWLRSHLTQVHAAPNLL